MLSKAYIEDYHYIKLIIHTSEMPLVNIDDLYVTNGRNNLKLSAFKTEHFGEMIHINTTFKGRINLYQDYWIEFKDGNSIHLDLGQIMRTDRFDVENEYDGPLGIEYHEDYTIFRVWSPVAKEIRLVFPENDTSYNLKYQGTGLWSVKVEGALDGYKYHYVVRINSDYVKTLDPYALSSDANSENNYVIDFNKTYPMCYDSREMTSYLDAVIYELHLKDVNDQNKKSAYLALIDKLSYIKNLGITHLQIMPLNAFGGIDEQNPDSRYNWGYNPVEFNSPTGWYASSPSDAYARVNELKEMIDHIHKQKMNVNLDVVYNHVYNAEEFAMNCLVPGYVYRTDKQGFLTNGSGCGCDFASERRMNRRFIIDSLKHWVIDYHIDGFRFDLMGLLDYETLRIVRNELKKINPNIMLYGEGWNLPTSLPADKRATTINNWALPHYAYFNDYFRNIMRGEQFNDHGYVYNQTRYLDDVKFVIKGSSSVGTFLGTPSQSINYVECHDNLTFHDKLIRDKWKLQKEDKINYLILSLGLVTLSLGIPFIHAGEELGRTKKGIDNTYNLGLDVNGIKLEPTIENEDIVKALKYFISFRKAQPIFKVNNSDLIDQVFSIKNTDKNTVFYEVDDIMVIFKNNNEEEVFDTENKKLLFKATKQTSEELNQLVINEIGVYILQNKQ